MILLSFLNWSNKIKSMSGQFSHSGFWEKKLRDNTRYILYFKSIIVIRVLVHNYISEQMIASGSMPQDF